MNVSTSSHFLLGGAALLYAVACAEAVPLGNTGTTSPAVATSRGGAPPQPVTDAGGAGPVATIVPSSGSTLPGRTPSSGTPSEGTGGASNGSDPTAGDEGPPTSMTPTSSPNMPMPAAEMDAGANLTIAEVPEEDPEEEEDEDEDEEDDEEDDTPGFGGSSSGPGSGGSSTTPDDDPPTGSDTSGGFEYIVESYEYDDETSTATVDVSNGSICLSGTAVDAGANFDNWGAGLGLRLATMDGEVPFDAEAAGISSVTFTVTGDIGVALRVGVNTVSEPNAAIGRGLTADDLDGPGTYTVQFSSLYQPNWDTNMSGAALDQTDIDSVQFQTTSVQGSSTSFDFCIEDLSFD